MEKINEKIKKMAAKMATAMIEHDTDEWPPVCTLFAYQPQYPSKIVQGSETSLEFSNQDD